MPNYTAQYGVSPTICVAVLTAGTLRITSLLCCFTATSRTNYINAGEIEAGTPDFDYTKLSDEDAETAREDMVQTKGFFILPSQLFCNVLQRADADENLNETLEGIFRSIEGSAQGCESEDDFKGLFDDFDVNSNKLGGTVAKRNERLVKLMNGVASMQLGDYQDNTIDAFGDAYEYLMGMYASNAGKSGGEYYTPQEVSELLTRLATAGKTEVNKVYDKAVARLIQGIPQKGLISGLFADGRPMRSYFFALPPVR